jgi:hypothetical protein
MAASVLFEERQYLGYNKYSIVRRMVLAIFCFVLYYWSENPKPVNVGAISIGAYPARQIEGSGHLFFLLGLGVLLLSIILIFVLHLRTKVTSQVIILRGFLKTRPIEIPLQEILFVKKVRFKETIVNRPTYHLNFKGKIRFYSRGNEAVELSRSDGTIYRIGSQRADELLAAIRKGLEAFVKNKV